jgi:hypothetical protein
MAETKNVSELGVISEPSSLPCSPLPLGSFYLLRGAGGGHVLTIHHLLCTLSCPEASVIPVRSLSSAMYITTYIASSKGLSSCQTWCSINSVQLLDTWKYLATQH